MLVVAAIAFVGGVWSTYHAIRVMFWWPVATAQILRYQIKRRIDQEGGQPFYHPVVRFETADGQQILTISYSGTWRRRWSAGQTVSLYYNPANPLWVEIGWFDLWMMPLTCYVGAAWFTIFHWFFGHF